MPGNNEETGHVGPCRAVFFYRGRAFPTRRISKGKGNVVRCAHRWTQGVILKGHTDIALFRGQTMVRAGNQALAKIQRAVLRLQQPSQPFQKGLLPQPEGPARCAVQKG